MLCQHILFDVKYIPSNIFNVSFCSVNYYYIDQPCITSFSIGLKMNLGSFEIDLGR